MPNFEAHPQITSGDLPSDLLQALRVLTDNVELLTGLSGEVDPSSQSVLKGDIKTVLHERIIPQAINATGSGYVIQNRRVVSLDDYELLLKDIVLINLELEVLRNVVSSLLQELKGTR